MTANLLELYPQPGQTQTLTGLYLAHRLHERGSAAKPFVYANFVSSIDGRIAVSDPTKRSSFVPESMTTASDWSLFQQLQAQADCLVTHGGYLRALATGQLDDILQTGLSDDSRHLAAWRAENGLPAQPGIVVVSRSLNFPIPPSVREFEQTFHIVTTADADRTRVKLWREKGFEILFAGHGARVEARPLVGILSELGFRSIYLLTGALMLGTMLEDQSLGRLYLTQSHQLVGGENFQSLVEQTDFARPWRLDLRSLYFAPACEHESGQFFLCFEPCQKSV